MKYIFTLLLTLFLTFTAYGDVIDREKEWTVMVFVNGDNNLDQFAFEDLNEMEMAGSNDWLNIVVQYDRYSSNSTANWSTARRFYVTKDLSPTRLGSEMIEDIGEIDSGDYNEVVNFVQWAKDNYPARKYGLIIWNHGDGWSKNSTNRSDIFKGFSSDDTNGGHISVVNGDYEEMLSQVTTILGQPLDLLGFDACLMAMWEVMYIAKDYALYFSGSEETEAGEGWEYSSLFNGFISGEHTAENLCKNISTSSIDSVGATLSCLNLQVMDNLDTALNNFATRYKDNDSIDNEILSAWGQAPSFTIDGSKDLGKFFKVLRETVSNSEDLNYIVEVDNALNQLIIENNTSDQYSDATGISIYMPLLGGYDSTYDTGRWSEETQWDDFIKRGFSFGEDQYEDDNSFETATVNSDLSTQSHTLHVDNDVDYTKFSLIAGETYSFETVCGNGDTVMELYSSSYSKMRENDDMDWGNRCSKVEITPSTNQDVYVKVFYYDYGGTAVYALKTVSTYEYCEETNGGVEICDNIDNNCNGQVDEGVLNSCGYCGDVPEESCDGSDNDCDGETDEGDLCSTTNGTASCIDARCQLTTCESGYYDINGDYDDGCEYLCQPEIEGVELCDGEDNDCDGVVDEGDLCIYNNGEGICNQGSCELISCEEGYYNNNSDIEDGCEYQCTITNGGVEICDDLDNNCNGNIDENRVCKTDDGGSGCSYSTSNGSNFGFLLLFLAAFITIFRKKYSK